MKKQMDKKHSNSGFTLAELLIVVAIIGILVAISIPIFTAQLHKARVATDWANLRAYFSEIQADYNATGEYNPEILKDLNKPENWHRTGIDFLDGQKAEMKDGYFAVTKSDEGAGYQISYYCNECLSDWKTHGSTCMKVFGAKG